MAKDMFVTGSPVSREDEIRKLDELMGLFQQLLLKSAQTEQIRKEKIVQTQSLQKNQKTMPDHDQVIKKAEQQGTLQAEAKQKKRAAGTKALCMVILAAIFALSTIPYFLLTAESLAELYPNESPAGVFAFTVPALLGLLLLAMCCWARRLGMNWWAGIGNVVEELPKGLVIAIVIVWALSVFLLFSVASRVDVFVPILIAIGVLAVETVVFAIVAGTVRKKMKSYNAGEKRLYQKAYQAAFAVEDAAYLSQVQEKERHAAQIRRHINHLDAQLRVCQQEYGELLVQWNSCDYMPDYYKRNDYINLAKKKLVSGEAASILEALYQIEAQAMRKLEENLREAKEELRKLKGTRALDMENLETDRMARKIQDEKLYNQTMHTLRSETDAQLVRAAELKEDTRKKKLAHGVIARDED